MVKEALFALALVLFAFVALAQVEEKAGAQLAVPSEASLPSFRWGQTLGCCPGTFDDAKLTTLSARGGCDTQRKKLPEAHLDRWGYGIELGDSQHCFDLGMRELVGYLCTPTAAHSSYSSDAENYPPLNLYEPIFLSDGSVNPDNYWASYVNRTVAKIWEIWNEPDWTSDWTVVASWLTTPPDPAKIPHWHGTIFEYIRILRVSYEVVKHVDPTAWVAVGGLGYTQFLDAILRYTDEPTAGALATGYESFGGAWFDCLSFHCYPMYGISDAETGKSIDGSGSDVLARRFVTLKKNFQITLSKYGFDGATYPKKMFIATETGVASQEINGYIGGPTLRRNYIAKLPLLAIASGVRQAHWFMLYDGGGTSPYGWMGDYGDISSETVDTAVPKNSTQARVAFQSLGIGAMKHSSTSTASLQGMLPANVTGVVLGNSTVQLWAVWRVCQETADDEAGDTATVSVQLTLPAGGAEYAWTGFRRRAVSSTTTVTLQVSGSPTYLLLNSGISPDDDDDGGGSTASLAAAALASAPIVIITAFVLNLF